MLRVLSHTRIVRFRDRKSSPEGAHCTDRTRFSTLLWPLGASCVCTLLSAIALASTVSDMQIAPEGKGQLLERWRGVRELVARGAVPAEKKRDAAMVLVWGQIVDELSGNCDAATVEQLSARLQSTDSAASRLADTLSAYDAEGDTLAKRRGTFFSAYISGLDNSGQLYLLHVPQDYDPKVRYPLEVRPADYVDAYDAPHDSDAACEHFVLSPCGRGENAIESIGELDALEAIRDVREHYSIDPDRIYLAGGSIGGGGVWRLACRYPDMFAAAVVSCGWTWTSRIEVENACNIPMWVLHGDADRAVPVDESRLAVKCLSSLAASVIYNEVPGAGHGGFKENPEWDRNGWLLSQRRNGVPKAIHYTTETPARRRAYWVEILRFADPNTTATVRASARTEGEANEIFLSLENVDVLAVEIPKGLVDPGKPLRLVAGGAPVTVPCPLPPKLFLRRAGSAGATYSLSLADPREVRAFRPYTAGGLSSMYLSGEPLMIVRPTGGDDRELLHVMDDFCRQLSCRATGWWPFPMDVFCLGGILVKADVDVTAQDIARNNLIIVGPASANRVLAKISDRLPAVEQKGTLTVAGEKYDLKGKAYGLFYYNPEAPKRLIMVMSSTEASFFKNVTNGITDRVAEDLPLGLTLRQVEPAMLVREVAWDNDWRVPAEACGDDMLPAELVSTPAAMGSTVMKAMCSATGADFAMYWNETPMTPWDPSHARWYDLKSAIGQPQTLFTSVATGADIRRLLQATRVGKTHVGFYPVVKEDELIDDAEYRLCMDPRMACDYVGILKRNLDRGAAVRVDLYGEVRRTAPVRQENGHAGAGGPL